jgi:thioredoxin-related protein
MKKMLFLFCLLVAAGCTNAQNNAQANTEKKTPADLPPYHILTTDSVYTTPADLKKNKPVMIIYFAPDCSHCQHLMYELKPKMAALKNVQVVMITFVQQIKAIQVFYRDFDLAKQPNFTVGTEGYSMVVQRFYDVRTTPYIALYDKKHKLVKSWDKTPPIDELTGEAGKL